jgi:hypothetical protein
MANGRLQLRRAITIQAEGRKLFEKQCYRAVSCKALLGALLMKSLLQLHA